MTRGKEIDDPKQISSCRARKGSFTLGELQHVTGFRSENWCEWGHASTNITRMLLHLHGSSEASVPIAIRPFVAVNEPYRSPSILDKCQEILGYSKANLRHILSSVNGLNKKSIWVRLNIVSLETGQMVALCGRLLVS